MMDQENRFGHLGHSALGAAVQAHQQAAPAPELAALKAQVESQGRIMQMQAQSNAQMITRLTMMEGQLKGVQTRLASLETVVGHAAQQVRSAQQAKGPQAKDFYVTAAVGGMRVAPDQMCARHPAPASMHHR
jgi:hypothetical protein